MIEKVEKVIFNIASEPSYVHILSGQKLIKNAKKFGEFLKVLPDRSIVKEQKLVENAKIEKRKCDILNDFPTM